MILTIYLIIYSYSVLIAQVSIPRRPEQCCLINIPRMCGEGNAGHGGDRQTMEKL